tara:strand:+ start:392 stop:733 length:342 start_codon:yes stop_codon:yes gene_type:complete
MDWPLITNKDYDRLIESIDLGDEFFQKLAIFRSGLIPFHLRQWQLNAHKAYDILSERELEVFKMRLKSHTFPMIAQSLGISDSSAKTYWRRAIKKCWDIFPNDVDEKPISENQ